MSTAKPGSLARATAGAHRGRRTPPTHAHPRARRARAAGVGGRGVGVAGRRAAAAARPEDLRCGARARACPGPAAAGPVGCRRARVAAAASSTSGAGDAKEGSGSAPGPGGASDNSTVVVLQSVGRTFSSYGYFSFWTQLILTAIAACILVFSVGFSSFGQRQEGAAALYITAIGLAMAFVSTFWAFGYGRVGRVLKRAAAPPEGGGKPVKPPNRQSVMQRLKFGIMINMVGFFFTLTGLQATVGLLVAKTLTTVAANPFLAGASPSFNPVMALDVFLVQATTNVLLSHFAGMAFTLFLLRQCASVAPTPAAA